MERVALLVSVGEYGDPLLRKLRAPAQDVRALGEVLAASEVGGFGDVRTVVDRPRHEIEEAVEDVLATRKPGDTVVLYFTCRGVKDVHGRLYLAAANTRTDRLASTAVSSSYINQQMEHSRASAKVALLDCCYSGAFVSGFATKAGPQGDLASQLCGRGTYVITATNSLEYAYEGSAITEGAPMASSFTDALVRGLRSGQADWDGDGLVSPEDLYWYLDRELRSAPTPQTPTSFSSGVQGAVYLAKAPGRAGAARGDETAARQEVERSLRDLEVQYASVREVLPSGSQRTASLDDVPAEAAALGGGAERLGILQRRLGAFPTAEDSERIVTLGLCLGAEKVVTAMGSVAVDGITWSRSAMEQFWAMRVAKAVASRLPRPDRTAIRRAVEDALRSGKLDADSSRTFLAESILLHDVPDVDG